ncbi:MAG TPA: hypothetical protein VIH99_02380 [Bdellovibrionota bacterium]|jgi:hypothetical protein
MKNFGLGIFGCAALLGTMSAQAVAPLSTDQLVRSIQESLKDYTAQDPEMAKSITGLKVVTVGTNAQVLIEMKTDGMNMTAKYLCIAQGQSMACREQQ